MGISSLYEWLLKQALQSKDPESLACLAEELIKGKHLAADGRMAYRAAQKADALSGFMGAYILGHMSASSKPDFAIKQLTKGCRVGHIPSLMVRHHLISKRIPLFGVLIGQWFKVIDSIRGSRVGYKYNTDSRRLWRILDLLSKKKEKRFLTYFGPDRQRPFSRIDALIPVTASHSNAPDIRSYK